MGIKTKPIQSPFAPLKDVAGIYLKQALLDIQLNFQKQRIYPTEVYRGYEKVNQYRREHGQWWSRGDGAKSFEGTVYQANEETGELTVGIRYNDYRKFVNIGVVLTVNPHYPKAHIPEDKVVRTRNV